MNELFHLSFSLPQSSAKNKAEEGDLTIQKLKTYKNFESITDQEAQENLITIRAFARVLADIHKQQNK
jgi:hypothetical protein